jgi:hypothetical protein
MSRTRAEIEAELDQLRSNDFNNWNTSGTGLQRLYVLLPELARVSTPRDATLTILKLIERLSDTPDLGDCELGTPGPMVHELEKLAGYEPQLIESVDRFPTYHTVWMVNRIMNTLDKDDHWAQLLDVLKRAAVAARAAPGARENARRFIRHQLDGNESKTT